MDWIKIITVLEAELNLENTRGGLANLLGIRPGIISDIKNGKAKNPGSNIALLLINKLNVNPKWLESGGLPIFLDKQRSMLINEKSPPIDKHISMPTIIGDHNTQVMGNENKITASTRENNEYDELFALICDYATPKMLKELKEKLLKIKEMINE